MKERIALGFGDNIDYEIVWNSKVIETLISQYNIHHDELGINRVISGERDLVISILSFLRSGTGGERIVSSSAILEHFSRNFKKKITLGGTPVRAAIAMRKLGYTSALHLVTINDHVLGLLRRYQGIHAVIFANSPNIRKAFHRSYLNNIRLMRSR